jgi:hypothetical protein
MGLSRSELFARLGLLAEVDDLTAQAYRFDELMKAGTSDQGSAVSDAWHLSFHGSQFPGNADKACPRQLLYRMLDIPRSTGSYLFSNRKLEQIADAGKDIEDRLVMKWHNAGYLVTPPPVDVYGHKQEQMVFENPDVWLTSTVDSILLKPRSIRPYVCEVKSKYADVIADMKRLIRGPDEKHVKQIKTQISLAHEHFTEHPKTVHRCFNTDRMAIPILLPRQYVRDGEPEFEYLCPQHLTRECLYEQELLPPEYGFLYYVSRDNPVDTFEFYVGRDDEFFQAGRRRLEDTKRAFIDNILPQSNFVDKRYAHPFGWLWGDQPCKWCDYGAECRIDNKRAIERGEPIQLSDSEAIETAKGIRPDYDFDLVRAAVYGRWDHDPAESVL